MFSSRLASLLRSAAVQQQLTSAPVALRFYWPLQTRWPLHSCSRSPCVTAAGGSPHRLFHTACAASSPASAGAAMSTQLAPRAKVVLDYWLGPDWESAPLDDTRPACSKLWFGGGPEVDADIIARFSGDCEALLRGEYDSWRQRPLEALAGIIIGDQLMRNAFRGTAKMYAADPKVLSWSKGMLDSGEVKQLTPIQQVWVLMPLMHSEELADQNECVAQFGRLAEECRVQGLEAVAKRAEEHQKFGVMHQEVVKQWGRFPHRNAILGRQDTPEEAAGIAAGTIPKW